MERLLCKHDCFLYMFEFLFVEREGGFSFLLGRGGGGRAVLLLMHLHYIPV